MNTTIFQYFHWYFPGEKKLWISCMESASQLANLGITHIWLPPAFKSAKGSEENGYAVYDLYDLGEFDQKGSIATRHGTREDYLKCIKHLHDLQIQVIADTVLNHKMGGDEEEKFPVIWVNPHDRNEKQSEREEITEKIRFTFPGRRQKYSNFIWDWQCFTGLSRDKRIGLIQNQYADKGWDESLDKENGNYDYLMGYDVEFRNPAVREELFKWGEWYIRETGVDGLRLDGLKHMNSHFFTDFMHHLEEVFGKPVFSIGEFWKNDVGMILEYLNRTKGKIQLFDVPLHFRFHEAGQKGKNYDLRTLTDQTLTQTRPEVSITFVENHDTQPLQALHSNVEPWFKPHAYAICLLREQGIPCIFHPDLYGAKYYDEKEGSVQHVEYHPILLLEEMMKIRMHFSFGYQRDYFDAPNLIGWVREGISEKPGSGFAVLLNTGSTAEKWMSLGEINKGRELYEVSGDLKEHVRLNEKGEGLFKAKEGTVTIWLFTEAQNLMH